MQFHFNANQSHFHENGFALKLALKLHVELLFIICKVLHCRLVLKQRHENSEMAY